MSGLLPRTTENQQNGAFTNLTVQNLNVTLVGFINSLVANSLNVANFIVNTFTSNTINSNIINTQVENVTQELNINTSIGQGIELNCTNTSVVNNEISFNKNGVYGGSAGLNLVTNETYLWSQNALKFGTSGTERLRIDSAGIATDNTANNVLALQGTTLVSKNNLIDTATPQTLTNKMINSSTNSILINGTNVDLLLNQDVRLNSSPIFLNLGVQALVNGGVITVPSGGGTLAKTTDVQTLLNKTINSANNTLQVNGVNINTLINQAVLTSSTPTFSDIILTNFGHVQRANSVVNALSTTITVAGVFTAINIASLSTTFSNLFSSSGNTGVTYTDATTRKFLVSYSISMSSNGNQLTAGRLTLNGTAITGTTSITHSHGGGVGISTATASAIIQLSNTNVVDMQITNQTNTNAIVVSWASLVLAELPAV